MVKRWTKVFRQMFLISTNNTQYRYYQYSDPYAQPESSEFPIQFTHFRCQMPYERNVPSYCRPLLLHIEPPAKPNASGWVFGQPPSPPLLTLSSLCSSVIPAGPALGRRFHPDEVV